MGTTMNSQTFRSKNNRQASFLPYLLLSINFIRKNKCLRSIILITTEIFKKKMH